MKDQRIDIPALPITELTLRYTEPKEIYLTAEDTCGYVVGFFLELKLDTGNGYGLAHTGVVRHQIEEPNIDLADAWAQTMLKRIALAIGNQDTHSAIREFESIVKQVIGQQS